MNVWAFTGNLGQDCEIRATSNGDGIVNFSVGVKSGYGDRATTTWARCSMFGKRGEAVAQYLTKGQLVGVTGEVTLREYESASGKGKSLDVRVIDLTLLGKRDAQAAQPQSAPQRQSPADDIDQDIPF